MSNTYCLKLPLEIVLGVRKLKKYPLNLNAYRNWHYNLSNNIKKAFVKQVSETNAYKFFKENFVYNPEEKLTLTYTIYTGNKRKFDVTNKCCVLDKFFCDLLVTDGIIPDDNYTIIDKVSFVVVPIEEKGLEISVVTIGKSYGT